MTEWIAAHAALSWLAVAVLLAVIELISLDFVLLMFGLGALAASVVTFLGAPLWLAVAVFTLVSVASLFVLRPALLHRLHSGPTLATGFANLVGKDALVLQPVGPRGGRVQIGTEEWTARTSGNEAIDVGAEARVVAIDGATAVVTAVFREGES
ncbi:MAG TPA: NfeD family protein [Aeromicrobium sp.]|nr:NfeD family protein [Aeromicrobium sp.]